MKPIIEPASQLGMSAPSFDLLATDGERYSLDSFSSAQALVVMFICNHCPYVKAINDRLVALGNDYDARVAFAAICSNDPIRYPSDNFEAMTAVANELGYPFPYLWDETQVVARAYDAKCTPDIYVFDADRKLTYRGQLDDNWRDRAAVKRHDLREAIDAVLAGAPPIEDQVPAMGCSIKWK